MSRFILAMNDQWGLRRIYSGDNVQVIDNWATVTGDVTEIRQAVDGTTLVLKVKDVEDFEDYPNLFNWAKGQLITVEIPKTARPPEVGAEINWRLRIVSPGNSVPHPSTLASL